MVGEIRWPPPPHRISRVIGVTPVLLTVLSAALALGGALLFGITLFVMLGTKSQRDTASLSGYWLPILVCVAIGAGLLWLAWRVGQSIHERRRLARDGAMGGIVEADLLFAGSLPRMTGTVWSYAYWQGGRRCFERRVGIGEPLFLDVAQTRCPVLLVEGGAELIFRNLYPLRLGEADRKRIQGDVARRLARAAPILLLDLVNLEGRTVGGPQRDYVRCFRQAVEADGRLRERLIWRRHAAARRLGPEIVDGLLSACRLAAQE
jgi:hypothetical protein